jgi:hypothetical protein
VSFDQKAYKSQWAKKYRKDNPEKIYDLHLKNRYGVSLETYNAMLLEQNGLCAICGQPETRLGRGRKVRKLSLDHNHKTKKVRKLLCDSCNKAVGNVKESVDIAIKLVNYIKEHES